MAAAVLTAREQEVVVLLARGLTNRQIGDELVISAQTAQRHVENILAKLGFRTRAQIAAWATAEGLVSGGCVPISTGSAGRNIAAAGPGRLWAVGGLAHLAHDAGG
jgi:DNA-binding CsgD family transcriptional regulator